MALEPLSWFVQAEYDLESAEVMFKGGKYIYTIFMCHLSLEKALKGLYVQQYKNPPPRVHNLVFFVEKNNLKVPADLYDLISTLNRVSVPTRYPEDLSKLIQSYDQQRTQDLLMKSKEVLSWLKKKLLKPSGS